MSSFPEVFASETPIAEGTQPKGTAFFHVQLELQIPRVSLPTVSEPRKIPAAAVHRLLFGDDATVQVDDAQILLLPLRTLKGLYSWVTGIGTLKRLRGHCERAGVSIPWSVPTVENGTALTDKRSHCRYRDRIVLEEFLFKTRVDDSVGQIGSWLSNAAFIPARELRWWRLKLEADLTILAEQDFQQLAQSCFRTPSFGEGDGSQIFDVFPVDTVLAAPLSIHGGSPDAQLRYPQAVLHGASLGGNGICLTRFVDAKFQIRQENAEKALPEPEQAANDKVVEAQAAAASAGT